MGDEAAMWWEPAGCWGLGCEAPALGAEGSVLPAATGAGADEAGGRAEDP
jgi:hypothetical protein